MTNPNIERDKVEDKPAHERIIHLQTLLKKVRRELFVSEKRAEEMEANLADMTGQRDWWQQECEEARSSLMRVREALSEIEKRTHGLCTFGALERAIDCIGVAVRSALQASGDGAK